MKGAVLSLRNLSQTDRNAVAQFFGVVERFWGRALTKEEVQRAYSEGVELVFVGQGPSNMKALKYVAFYQGFSKGLPLKLTVRCQFSTVDHKNIMGNDAGNAIVAGTLTDLEFVSYSDTWLLDVKEDSPAFHLGSAVNAVVLEHFGIPI